MERGKEVDQRGRGPERKREGSGRWGSGKVVAGGSGKRSQGREKQLQGAEGRQWQNGWKKGGQREGSGYNDQRGRGRGEREGNRAG